ncbi:MAG: hypothetical protein AB8G14_00805 [Ilumatobacter sp.]
MQRMTITKALVVTLAVACVLTVLIAIVSFVSERSVTELATFTVAATVLLVLAVVFGRYRWRRQRRKRFMKANAAARDALFNPENRRWMNTVDARRTAGEPDGLPTHADWGPPTGPAAST